MLTNPLPLRLEPKGTGNGEPLAILKEGRIFKEEAKEACFCCWCYTQRIPLKDEEKGDSSGLNSPPSSLLQSFAASKFLITLPPLIIFSHAKDPIGEEGSLYQHSGAHMSLGA